MGSLRYCKPKYSLFSCSAESTIELIRYTIMLEWRKKSAIPSLCLEDLDDSEKRIFEEQAQATLKRYGNKKPVNLFENREEKILMDLGILSEE